MHTTDEENTSSSGNSMIGCGEGGTHCSDNGKEIPVTT